MFWVRGDVKCPYAKSDHLNHKPAFGDLLKNELWEREQFDIFLYEKVSLHKKNKCLRTCEDSPFCYRVSGKCIFLLCSLPRAPLRTLCMDFSTDQLILLKQYCLALSCIDCKKSSISFPVLQQYNVLFFIFTKVVFYHNIF